MNIQEAMKLGKPFKRPNSDRLFYPGVHTHYTITRAELLADDWEVQEQKITITLKDLSNAFYEAYGYDRSEKALGLYTLADILGFKQQI